VKQILNTGLVLVGMASLPASVSPISTWQAHLPPDHRLDLRLASLERFFAKYDCPAGEFAAEFLEAADAAALDWRLLPSISYVETTGGKAAANNNMFGWDAGRTKFPTLAAGIHAVAFKLSHSDLYRNKSLNGILETYNPDPSYPGQVKSIMQEIAAVH
jgi:hypothetical protein